MKRQVHRVSVTDMKELMKENGKNSEVNPHKDISMQACLLSAFFKAITDPMFFLYKPGLSS